MKQTRVEERIEDAIHVLGNLVSGNTTQGGPPPPPTGMGAMPPGMPGMMPPPHPNGLLPPSMSGPMGGAMGQPYPGMGLGPSHVEPHMVSEIPYFVHVCED